MPDDPDDLNPNCFPSARSEAEEYECIEDMIAILDRALTSSVAKGSLAKQQLFKQLEAAKVALEAARERSRHNSTKHGSRWFENPERDDEDE